MRKAIWIMVVLVSAVFIGVVFAADKAQKTTETKQAAHTQMMDEERMHEEMAQHAMMEHGMKEHDKMKQGMMDKKIIATQDGGVVLWMGNKLVKFDKDLKQVGEAEVKMEMPAMCESKMNE
jgi:hypothetical protein